VTDRSKLNFNGLGNSLNTQHTPLKIRVEVVEYSTLW